MIIRVSTLLLLVLLSFFSLANQPLYSHAQSPIHANFLSVQLREAQPMPTGSIEFKSAYTQASIWAETDDYFMDYYQNHIDIALAFQVTSFWKSEIGYKKITARNNGLDSLTENFHNFFGIGHNGRDEVPSDQFTISIPELNLYLSDFEGDTLTNALNFYNEFSLYHYKSHFLSTGVSLYYNNVNDGAFARHSFEQSIQLNYTYHLKQHHFYTTLGIVHRNNNLNETILSDYSESLSFGYEYAFNSKHSLLLESHNYLGWANNNDDFSEISTEVLLGYRYTYKEASIEAIMIENAGNMDNSTDIAFTLSLRTTF